MYRLFKRTADSPVLLVSAGDLHRRVDELSGRSNILSIPSIARKLQRDGIIYIATNRGSQGRELFGRGFIIEWIAENT